MISSLRIPILIAVTLILLQRPTYGQVTPGCYPNASKAFSELVHKAAHEVAANGDDGSIVWNEMVVRSLVDALTLKSTLDSRREAVVLRAETLKTDKQIGASSAGASTTTLAEKPDFAKLLGLAIEHGAVQKDVQDSTLTLSTSPYAFIAAIHGDTAAVYQNNELFRRIGAAANFSVTDGQNSLASARRQQLQAWSIRVRLTADRSARSDQFTDYWRNNVASKLEAPAIVITGTLNTLMPPGSPLLAWEKTTRASFLTAVKAAGTNDQAVETAMLCFLQKEILDKAPNESFPLTKTERTLLSSLVPSQLKTADLSESEGRASLEKELKRMQDLGKATLVYNNTRDPQGSDYSTGKVLFESHISPTQIIANIGASFYHHPDLTKNQQTLRDMTAALSFEGEGGRSPFLTNLDDQSPITYSFSGSYRRLIENRHVAGKKADITAVQLKIELPIQSGMSFPIGFTYATATETTPKKNAQIVFGFAFDMDKLFALAQLASKRK